MFEITKIIEEMKETGNSYSLQEMYQKLEENGNFSKKYMPGMTIRDYLDGLLSVGFLSKKDEKYFVARRFKKVNYISKQQALELANQLSVLELLDKVYQSFESSHNNIVCLCGSTKFKTEFEEATKRESLNGKIVLSVAMFGHLEGLDMSGEEKQFFDKLHFQKIDLAGEILVLNVGGYIGESTSREIAYAKSLNKKIRYLEAI